MSDSVNAKDFILDPLTYIGRVQRGEDGRVKTMEVFYDTDVIHLEDGDEFVTFTTQVLLEESAPAGQIRGEDL